MFSPLTYMVVTKVSGHLLVTFLNWTPLSRCVWLGVGLKDVELYPQSLLTTLHSKVITSDKAYVFS